MVCSHLPCYQLWWNPTLKWMTWSKSSYLHIWGMHDFLSPWCKYWYLDLLVSWSTKTNKAVSKWLNFLGVFTCTPNIIDTTKWKWDFSIFWSFFLISPGPKQYSGFWNYANFCQIKIRNLTCLRFYVHPGLWFCQPFSFNKVSLRLTVSHKTNFFESLRLY